MPTITRNGRTRKLKNMRVVFAEMRNPLNYVARGEVKRNKDGGGSFRLWFANGTEATSDFGSYDLMMHHLTKRTGTELKLVS